MHHVEFVETVKIVHEGGFKVINAEDFVEGKMKLFREAKASEKPSPIADEPMSKEDCVSALEASGVDFNRNLGVRKLREMVAELAPE